MAWNEFYLDTGGSDTNSGHTASTSTLAATTNGDWGSAAANRFTAASGTPFSGVSVGDWASVYLDGAASAVYLAKVNAVNGGGASIDLDTTAKYGTAPTTGATGRSCKVGGAWASLAAPISAFGSTTLYNSTRVNAKAGTYANTTTTRTFAFNGSNSAPFWLRGYNTTPGDLDEAHTLSLPAITFTTGGYAISGDFQTHSSLDISGARTAGAQVNVTGNQVVIDRCRIANTAANANSHAVSCSAGFLTLTRNYITCTTSANPVTSSSTGVLTVCWNYVVGGSVAVNMVGFNCRAVVGNIITGPASHGIYATTANASANFWSENDIYNCGGDGIRVDALPTGQIVVANNRIANSAGYGVNNNSGANGSTLRLFANDFYSNALGNLNAIAESLHLSGQTDSASPFAAAGTDFTPAGTSNARGNAAPKRFENVTAFSSSRDVGAVQHADPVGVSKLVPAMNSW